MNNTSADGASGSQVDAQGGARTTRGSRGKIKVVAAVVVILAITIVTAGWLAGWFAPTSPAVASKKCAGNVELAGVGAYSVGPAMRSWSAEFNTTACAKVTYASVGSGVDELAAKSVDFAVVDTPLNSSEVTQLGLVPMVLPVALEATSVVYNIPGVPTGLHLTGGTLAAIYLGAITNWNNSTIQALNPAVRLPSNLPITPVHCSGGCPTTLLFTGYLSQANSTWNDTIGASASPTWPAVGAGESGSLAVASEVGLIPGAIGYAELPLAQQANLTWADLQNPADAFVSPSAANTTAAAATVFPTLPPETGLPSNLSILNEAGATSYPMATLSYVVVYQDVGVAYNGTLTKVTAQWLGAYILWVTTAAQPNGIPLGYAPLPAILVTWNQDSLEKLLYDGVSVLPGGDSGGEA